MSNGPTRRVMTPEERRAALLKTQRETTRVVKRALIGIAFFAAAYYIFLIKTQPSQTDSAHAPQVEQTLKSSSVVVSAHPSSQATQPPTQEKDTE